MPGYPVYEYFLILSLPAAIRDEVAILRDDFHKNFQTNDKIRGKPTLALALFLQYETMEERLMQSLERIAAAFEPMTIHLKDFGSFPRHSILVSVIAGSPAYALAKSIRTDAKNLLQVNQETKPMIMLQPHIGIARKLKPEVFDLSWPIYTNKKYENSFVAKEMMLLRRLTHDDDWQLAGKFPFRGETAQSKQGNLFDGN